MFIGDNLLFIDAKATINSSFRCVLIEPSTSDRSRQSPKPRGFPPGHSRNSDEVPQKQDS